MKYEPTKNYSCLVLSIDLQEQIHGLIKSLKFNMQQFLPTSSVSQMKSFLQSLQIIADCLNEIIKLSQDEITNEIAELSPDKIY